MNRFFAYIRVSTAKQGEHGVSLAEQRDAITRFAARSELKIVSWFEERQTAAKRGRPVFNRMLKFLKSGRADGVVIHKIDRSARNLKDWADLGELIDSGVEVHFANESLDLQSRGGRLSADIQAVVAADYIRNLREETRKGFYGRLKQGLYPLPAPVGYLNAGKGRKEIDPIKGPLVRRAFELYATGKTNILLLVDEMYRLGLRNRNGGKVTRNGMCRLLNNRFYMGLIEMKQSRETFAGAHQPLITKRLFDAVQDVLHGRAVRRTNRNSFLFARLLKCRLCGYSLIGESQKGHVYYRCHTRTCPTTGIREEAVDETLRQVLARLQFNGREQEYLAARLEETRLNWAKECRAANDSIQVALAGVRNRLGRLTDAYIDRMIDKEIFEERKAALLAEKLDLEQRQKDMGSSEFPDRLKIFLELAGTAYLTYELGSLEAKRDLVLSVTSNRYVDGKKCVFMLYPTFETVANRFKSTNGSPSKVIARTLDDLIHSVSNQIRGFPDARVQPD